MTEYDDVNLNEEQQGFIQSEAQANNGGCGTEAVVSGGKRPKTKQTFHSARQRLLRRLPFVDKKVSGTKTRRYDLLSHDNLSIPIKNKAGRYMREIGSSQMPLVSLQSLSDSDDLEGLSFAGLSNLDLRRQLAEDGYDLEGQCDQDDLDLVPPRPLHSRDGPWARCLPCVLL